MFWNSRSWHRSAIWYQRFTTLESLIKSGSGHELEDKHGSSSCERNLTHSLTHNVIKTWGEEASWSDSLPPSGWFILRIARIGYKGANARITDMNSRIPRQLRNENAKVSSESSSRDWLVAIQTTNLGDWRKVGGAPLKKLCFDFSTQTD